MTPKLHVRRSRLFFCESGQLERIIGHEVRRDDGSRGTAVLQAFFFLENSRANGERSLDSRTRLAEAKFPWPVIKKLF